jgi:D-alanyl-D-alanine carboxypeptidase
VRAALLLAVLALALPACAGDDTALSTSPEVEKLAEEIADAGVDRAIVFVSDDGDDYVATAGSKPVEADRRFRIGSVTKTLTATIVLQLVAEGELQLTDTLGSYVGGLPPRASNVTIRQLLNHTSGLANFTDYPAWLEPARKSDSTRPIDALRYAASQPQIFEPGSQHGYSNTNYTALGLVIEAATGRSYVDQLTERILDPVGLDSMELATTRQLPDLDDEGENPNLPWAAGSIVSNAEDLSSFFSALLSGEILSERSLALMKDTVPLGGSDGAGLGIFVLGLPCGAVWGHNGGIVDYGTLVGASEDGSRVVVVSLQGRPSGQLPDEDTLLCLGAAKPS